MYLIFDWTGMNARAKNRDMTQAWSPTDYREHAGFVPALGATILSMLAPRPGERILDLGCGDGVLTRQIAAAGAIVVGVDASPEMVDAAAATGLDAHVADARHLTFSGEFDAVFSNAVLHWIHDADAVLAGVARALKSGGRFVAEFGGHGNVAAIAVALRAVFKAHRIAVQWPWYYPTPEEYAARLEAAGLVATAHRARAPSHAAADRHGRLAAHVLRIVLQRGAGGSAAGNHGGGRGPSAAGPGRQRGQMDRGLRSAAGDRDQAVTTSRQSPTSAFEDTSARERANPYLRYC